jgi:hypothetical protein
VTAGETEASLATVDGGGPLAPLVNVTVAARARIAAAVPLRRPDEFKAFMTSLP